MLMVSDASLWRPKSLCSVDLGQTYTVRLLQDEDLLQELDDQISGLQDNIAYVQENISDCQSNIMQMEESKVR